MPHQPLTASDIRSRFAGTRMPDDPLSMSNPSAAWVRKLRDRLPPQLTAAAVLIPIVRRQEELTVLLTERSADLTHHAGQISFPGGRMDPEDSDICATALRETHEEVGIRAEHIEIVGYLPPNPTVTGYAVTPVVALVAPQPSLTIDPLEVRSAFEVPLSFLLDARNQRQTEREFEGIVLPLVEFIYAGHRIWGATAGMLVDFRDHLLKIE